MSTEALTFNRSVVLGSAIIYWSGVWFQARRVRQHIGRSPNVQPKGLKEKLLWCGWAFVVVAWLAFPLLSAGNNHLPGLRLISSLIHPFGSILGISMMALGYAGTLWCYRAMGDAWRMGVNRTEETQLVMSGPYQFVRHPIYLCQVVMIAAMAILLPSVLSWLVLVIHLLCVITKAADEESHLRSRLGQSYSSYCIRTGSWFPPLLEKKSTGTTLPATDQNQFKPAGHSSK
jgi:protein-S-isoprenylcysteine O-methyltransferase Ste14